ncbi:sulfatase family protein [Paenibacillus koleovorans]|uniref:sulfatase family protein n=1 Tax=Paenibacillus koleovorans TaxID=121608 RepID=UPI000FDB52CA|nr:sulfatase-like hydrolase/transferase [Paenibacillus koleovorans]
MKKTNVILVMCDDLGYGDTGFNGNTVIRTPHLDQLAREGAVFTRFHAGAPVCSPTRGTCLTGRHHYRYGITTANDGKLPLEELTLATLLQQNGYRTGHFGKWHLGTLSRELKDGRRGGATQPEWYSPPWQHGFDTCFSTEVAIPLWNPMENQPFASKYWVQEGQYAEDNLEGDDSRVIMDRAIPFIEQCAAIDEPFLAVVWFHAPHTPVAAGPEHRAIYADYSEGEQHYYGCVTAMDEQVGRLNDTLKRLSLEDDTLVWFCSDNGPEGPGGEGPGGEGRNRGSTGGLRGRKRSLFNGGTTVPTVLKWPKYVKPGTTYRSVGSTLDFLPTILEEIGLSMPDARPLDGVSLLPVLRGETERRSRPIVFRFVSNRDAMFGSPTFAVIDNEYKLLTNHTERLQDDMVFQLIEDPYESTNLIDSHPEFAERMRAYLKEQLDDYRRSHYGGDYANPDYKPLDPFISNERAWNSD